jgi:hypothetical protein
MKKNQEFVERLIEACGASKPTEIQQVLGISDQAARNYLEGRLPNTEMLITIAERTSCSIDWLLTGRGKKFLSEPDRAGAPPAAGQLEQSVRRICVEVINELSGRQETGQPKVVVLQSSELKSEKVSADVKTSAGRRR